MRVEGACQSVPHEGGSVNEPAGENRHPEPATPTGKAEGIAGRVDAISKVVILLTALINFFLLVTGAYASAAVVLGIMVLGAVLYLSVRIGFPRWYAAVAKLNWREAPPAWLRWPARAAIVLVVAAAVFLLCFRPTQQFICRGLGIAACASAPETTPLSQFGAFTYSDPEGKCIVRVAQVADPELGSVTQISFDPGTAETSYCGWGFRLGGYDASGQASVTFRLRGATGREAFSISLSDSDAMPEQEAAVAIRRARAAWHQVSIRMDRFQSQDPTSLDHLTLGFDSDTGPGTIYVADFRFVAGRP